MSGHVALFYRDTADLSHQLTGFLHRVECPADVTIVLSCRPTHADELRRLLHPAVVVDHLADIHTRPAAALAERRRKSPAGRPSLVVCEPDPGDDPADWIRAARYEAAASLVFADDEAVHLCAYPAAVPRHLREHLLRTHPRLLIDASVVTNAHHEDPVSTLRRLAATTPIAPPRTPPRLVITGSAGVKDLGPIRQRVSDCLAGIPTLVRVDFVAAVNEILTNAYLHGSPPTDLTLWTGHDRIECRITDHGTGHPDIDATAGYQPRRPDLRRVGAGLWLARQNCDDLDTWRTDGTFTVRLATATTPALGQQHIGAYARAEIAGTRAARAARRAGRLTAAAPGTLS